jgi:hypothetical protein
MSTTLPHKTEYATRASSQQNTVDACVIYIYIYIERERERERVLSTFNTFIMWGDCDGFRH